MEEIPQVLECPRIVHYDRTGEQMNRKEYSASIFPQVVPLESFVDKLIGIAMRL